MDNYYGCGRWEAIIWSEVVMVPPFVVNSPVLSRWLHVTREYEKHTWSLYIDLGIVPKFDRHGLELLIQPADLWCGLKGPTLQPLWLKQQHTLLYVLLHIGGSCHQYTTYKWPKCASFCICIG